MLTVPTRNWAGNVTYRATRIHQPTSVEQLCRLVGDSPRVRALGSGHSFSPIADSTGELVRLDRMPVMVDIDVERSLVSVAAGMSFADLADALQEAGFALANLASLPHISVAGACATGTHGSGDRQRSLAAAVAGLRLVGPTGHVQELRRGVDRDFPGAVVALGALGIVTHVTLDIEPSYCVAQEVRLDVPLAEAAKRWDELFGAAYSVSVFTDFASGRASVWLKRRTGASGSAWTGGRAATYPVHPVPGVPPEWCTPQLGVPGPWHQRLPHFRREFVPSSGRELQSEYYLARETAPMALAAISNIAGQVATVLQIAELRTVRADELWLSPAYGRDSATVHFTWIDDIEAVRPVIAAVDEALMALGARPHWGKLTTAAPQEIISRYPRRDDFAELMRRLDPAGKFANPYVEALFP